MKSNVNRNLGLLPVLTLTSVLSLPTGARASSVDPPDINPDVSLGWVFGGVYLGPYGHIQNSEDTGSFNWNGNTLSVENFTTGAGIVGTSDSEGFGVVGLGYDGGVGVQGGSSTGVGGDFYTVKGTAITAEQVVDAYTATSANPTVLISRSSPSSGYVALTGDILQVQDNSTQPAAAGNLINASVSGTSKFVVGRTGAVTASDTITASTTTASAKGVSATATSGFGVYGVSSSNFGVFGQSSTNAGVYGQSTSSNGVRGNTTNSSAAILGTGTNGSGVIGISTTKDGVNGLSVTGSGGHFIQQPSSTSASSPALLIERALTGSVGATGDLLQIEEENNSTGTVSGNLINAGTLPSSGPFVSEFAVDRAGHILSGGTAPSGANTGSTDARDTVTLSSASSATVTFAHAYGTAPIVILTPTNNPGATYWVTSSTTQFLISLSSSSSVTFNFVVLG